MIAAALALLIGFASMSPATAQTACNDTLLAELRPPFGTRLTAATLKTDAGVEYCEVRGVAGPGPSRIHFAVGLPTQNWNGRFLMAGDDGFDGTVNLPLERIAQGYAAANSDSGHAVPASRDPARSRGPTATADAADASTVMQQNVHALHERGEKLGELGDKSKKLSDDAENFLSLAKELRKQNERPFFGLF